MSDRKTLSKAGLAALVRDLAGQGVRVVAPVRQADGATEYAEITSLDGADLSGALPRRSLKSAFFPATEPLFSWTQRKGDVEIHPVPTQFPPAVVLGARPCDAVAVETLDKVMGWDYRDELWFGRREATTILSMACGGVDDVCFCAATGEGPDARKGADLLLVPDGEDYLAEVVTPKGRAFAEAHAAHFQEAGDAPEAEAFRAGARAKVAANLRMDTAAVGAWLAGHFEDPLWADIALRCHGCGACAALCPTCHCFDIVDESEGLRGGVRRRNWDTCQTSVFTRHASGHNPRADQHARIRQRLMHKFSIYPRKFGEVLCTGCGRCVRSCPAGMDLPEMLGRVMAAAAEGGTP